MARRMWGESMNNLSDEQVDRLESAHATFSRADGAARARLLAALAADVPSAFQPIRKARIETMRRYASRAAIAAALLVATTIAWQLNRPTNVFAQVAGAMSRAKGFRCDMVMVTPGYNDTEKAELIAHASWIPPGAARADHIQTATQDSGPNFRPGQHGLRLDHNA